MNLAVVSVSVSLRSLSAAIAPTRTQVIALGPEQYALDGIPEAGISTPVAKRGNLNVGTRAWNIISE
jgi:hypothetical protein